MRKNTLIGFGILLVLFLNSCTSKDNLANVQATGQLIYGIDKGDIAPDFTITTIEGKAMKLSEFKNDKPVLIYFWASWCPYCSQDFDVVKNIYPKYSDKVTFLAIDLDLNEKKGLIESYKNKKGLSNIDFAEGKESVLADYAIKYTTTKYAIGRSGAIIYKGSGVFDEKQWEVLLNGLASS